MQKSTGVFVLEHVVQFQPLEGALQVQHPRPFGWRAVDFMLDYLGRTTALPVAPSGSLPKVPCFFHIAGSNSQSHLYRNQETFHALS